MEEEEVNDAAKYHVSKRARYNSNTVVTFDDADRREFLSGFRKRKNKRRQAAEEQRLYKERQKRILDRRERREALKEATGNTPVAEKMGSGFTEDGEEDEDAIAEEKSTEDVGGTATYEDRETITVVRVGPISEEDYERADKGLLRKVGDHAFKAPKLAPVKVKPSKLKLKKPKRGQSEKRKRKLTRREKSVPKNLRSKRDKRRKK